jgi:formate/nitrite transporter FocA (FNT family)
VKQNSEFHLTQAWWRKMQKVGLSQEYKSSESEIGIWLKSIFGIAFLGLSRILSCFIYKSSALF